MHQVISLDESEKGSVANFRLAAVGYMIRPLVLRGWMVTIAFKGSHFERDVILWGVRWYVAYPLSYRQIEEMMEERGVEVDRSPVGPQICAGFWRGRSWRASVQWAAAGDWMRPM